MNNKLNYTALQSRGLHVDLIDGQSGPHIRIRGGDGRGDSFVIGAAAPPDLYESDQFDPETEKLPANQRFFVERDASSRIMTRLLSDFATLTSRGLTILSDSGLTPARKHTDVQKLTGEILPVMGKLFAGLQSIAAKLKTEDAALFAVPEPEKTGHAVYDGEIRSRFEQLDPDKRAGILRSLAEPRYARVALALARDPWPHSDADQGAIDAAWRKQVAFAKPQVVGPHVAAVGNSAWALATARQLADHAVSDGFRGQRRAMSNQDIYEALKPSGGVGLMSFGPAEIRMYDVAATAKRAAA